MVSAYEYGWLQSLGSNNTLFSSAVQPKSNSGFLFSLLPELPCYHLCGFLTYPSIKIPPTWSSYCTNLDSILISPRDSLFPNIGDDSIFPCIPEVTYILLMSCIPQTRSTWLKHSLPLEYQCAMNWLFHLIYE